MRSLDGDGVASTDTLSDTSPNQPQMRRYSDATNVLGSAASMGNPEQVVTEAEHEWLMEGEQEIDVVSAGWKEVAGPRGAAARKRTACDVGDLIASQADTWSWSSSFQISFEGASDCWVEIQRSNPADAESDESSEWCTDHNRYFVHVQVSARGSVLCVMLVPQSELQLPFRIVNNSELSVMFFKQRQTSESKSGWICGRRRDREQTKQGLAQSDSQTPFSPLSPRSPGTAVLERRRIEANAIAKASGWRMLLPGQHTDFAWPAPSGRKELLVKTCPLRQSMLAHAFKSDILKDGNRRRRPKKRRSTLQSTLKIRTKRIGHSLSFAARRARRAVRFSLSGSATSSVELEKVGFETKIASSQDKYGAGSENLRGVVDVFGSNRVLRIVNVKGFDARKKRLQNDLRKVRGPTMQSSALNQQANAISSSILTQMQNERTEYLNAMSATEERILKAFENSESETMGQ